MIVLFIRASRCSESGGYNSARRRGAFLPARSAGIALLLLASCFTPKALGGNWQSTLTKDPPGTFPELRPIRATYHFGWAGFTAATGEVHFAKPSESQFQLEATGRTTGFVRALWKLDVNYRALADAETLRPVETRQTESYRSKKITTHLTFTAKGVTRASGHEKISVRAGIYNAIKIDLQLHRLGKNLELEPHRKFRRATIWVSDDSDRIILRTEAQIFIGTVFAELQSVRFEEIKH